MGLFVHVIEICIFFYPCKQALGSTKLETNFHAVGVFLVVKFFIVIAYYALFLIILHS